MEDDNASTISDLTSAPSGIFSTTEESIESAVPGQTSTLTTTGNALTSGSSTIRKSHIYYRENGEEYIDSKGKKRWRCNRCRRYPSLDTRLDFAND